MMPFASHLTEKDVVCMWPLRMFHYVQEGSPLDQEARLRGTSIYFPDRVIPMLPERLSNGLCSLNPHVDRLVMAVWFDLRKDGSIGKTGIEEAVIQSCSVDLHPGGQTTE